MDWTGGQRALADLGMGGVQLSVSLQPQGHSLSSESLLTIWIAGDGKHGHSLSSESLLAVMIAAEGQQGHSLSRESLLTVGIAAEGQQGYSLSNESLFTVWIAGEGKHGHSLSSASLPTIWIAAEGQHDNSLSSESLLTVWIAGEASLTNQSGHAVEWQHVVVNPLARPDGVVLHMGVVGGKMDVAVAVGAVPIPVRNGCNRSFQARGRCQ